MRHLHVSSLAIFCSWIVSTSALSSAEQAAPVAASPVASRVAETELPANVDRSWWAAVQQRIRQEEYLLTSSVEPTRMGPAGAFQASNRAQGFTTYFTDSGIRVVPRAVEGRASWEWGLAATGWSRQGELVSFSAPSSLSERNRFVRQRPELLEWYVNDRSGLELGYTIDEPPLADLRRAASGGSSFALDLALRGTLHPALAADGQAIDFSLLQGGMKVLRCGSLAATDATGKALPVRFAGNAERGGGLRIVVDDDGAVYPLTIRSLTTGAAWTFESDQADAWLGTAVATAGDVNGDGYSDILVGAFFYDTAAGADGGKVWLFLGSASGLPGTAAWTFESDQAGARLGWAVASAGDVNGDGYADVAIAASMYDSPVPDEGKVWVFHGAATGLSTTPAWTGTCGLAAAYYGNSVANAGDVNGDGFSDLIVGAPEANLGVSREGTVYVYFGSASGLAASPSWSARGLSPSCWLGSSVSSAGDLNGDGYSDIVVGGNGYYGSISLEGGLFVWYGAADGLGGSGTPANASWSVRSGQSGFPRLGSVVGLAGDVNGDGYSDILAGAFQYDDSLPNEGKVWVFEGSATGLSCGAGCPRLVDAAASWTAVGGQFDAALGGAAASAGDVNGDGYADVILGAVAFDATAPGSNEGKSLLFLGSASGLGTSPAWSAVGSHTEEYFSSAVASAGDVDGDGFADVLVGSEYYTNGQSREGRASLFLGGPEGVLASSSWSAEGEDSVPGFGVSVASAGDVNGDGYGDVVVGDYQASATGKAYLFLGGADGLATDAVWTALGETANDGFGNPVAAAGDVNGDGLADLLVGASNYDSYRGKAYLYLGSQVGPLPSASWTGVGVRASTYFGFSLASAGDVNGDGYSDVVVGAGQRNTSYPGTAYLYLGGPAGLSSTWSWSAVGEGPNHRFGEAVSTAGDVNGDGYSDVLVGASYWDLQRGKAYLYLGEPAGLSAAPAWTLTGSGYGEVLGSDLATAGDVNGDGYSDVIVGAYGFGGVVGKAVLHLGGSAGLATTDAWTALGETPNTWFGYPVSSAGDVNGDGYSDVLVGAYGYPSGSSKGRTYLYLGSPAGLSTSAAWTATGENDNDSFGFSSGSAGDVNGDGFADVAVGAYTYSPSGGKAYLFLGGGGDGATLLPRQSQADGTTPIASLGRTHSDLLRTHLLGRTPFGRGEVKLEVEVKPLDEPLNGIGTSSTVNWGDTGVDGAPLSELTSISPSGPHHWRARLRYRVTTTPWMPGSRWVSMADNGPQETDLRVFADFLAPSGPVTLAALPPHFEGGWSTQSTISMNWSGATDEPGGTGLAGYSVAFDDAAATPADSSVEVPQTADPHAVTSLSFGNGAWYFHLRPCDVAGNCGSTVHRGPYGVDTAEPLAPTGLASPSHVVSVPSTDATIDLTWSAALDQPGLSGIDGYSYLFDANAGWTCDETKDVEEGALSVTSATLAYGEWYFHLCARDNAGNWGPVTSAGPFLIVAPDTTAPKVNEVSTVRDTGDGVLSSGESTEASLTQLTVTFDEAMSDTGPSSVTDLANWHLIAAGGNDTLETSDCAALGGDDLSVTVVSVAYDSVSWRATVRPAGSGALSLGRYRLLACPALADLAGNPLDGDGNGIGSDPFARDFQVRLTDLLSNPNLDGDLTDWVVTEPLPGDLTWQTSDADGKPTSGSARLQPADGTAQSYGLSQCRQVDAGQLVRAAALARTTSGSATAPSVQMVADFFAGAACAGSPLASHQGSPLAGSTSGAWRPLEMRGIPSPAGAGSVRLLLAVQGGSEAAFSVDFDNPLLAGDSELLDDGFESGGLGVWWGARR